MSVFRIIINQGPPAEFDPNRQEVFVNDSVFWFNADQTDAHWPSLISQQIPPNEKSEPVSFSVAGPVDYVCNYHSDERGRIIVQI